MTRLYIFADDSMLGRESGQLGNVRGTNYIAAEMQKMGLQPGGENGTYFQTVPVVFASIDPRRRSASTAMPSLCGGTSRPHSVAAPRVRSSGAIPTVFGGQIGGAMISPDQAAGKVVVFLPAARTGASTSATSVLRRRRDSPRAAAVARSCFEELRPRSRTSCSTR